MKDTKFFEKDVKDQKWWVLDATDLVVGRASVELANILRGKHKVQFTPHQDLGDHVIILNADKALFTGTKEQDKRYYDHSGWQGGLRTRTVEDLKRDNPGYIFEHAIAGMLPKNAQSKRILKKLHVFAGTEHPHQAQNPQPLVLSSRYRADRLKRKA